MPTPQSRPSRPPAAALALVGLASAGCVNLDAPPSLDGEVALGPGLSAGPSAGLSFGASQRLVRGSDHELHVEIELHQQDLDPTRFEGERLDGRWSQVRGGFKAVLVDEDPWNWTGRLGVTWIRPVGDPVYVDEPEDYGGFYLGAGLERLVGSRLLFSPDLALLGLFQESAGESGVGLQLTLRLYLLP